MIRSTPVIATTRPELLPACVAAAVHPEDPRHRHLIGRSAITPLFRAPVPVFGSESGFTEVRTFRQLGDEFTDAADHIGLAGF
jgi:valyl-tRNA synthetase